MRRSSAAFISYDLRPAKQSERRILIDLLKLAGDCGLPIGEYRYIGMGANRFYDFLLLHKYVGIKSMISLERDASMFKRAIFNVPFRFINVINKSTTNFIDTDDAIEPSIYWLDYDGGIGGDIIGDIATFSSKLKINDFCFVTVFGGPPGALQNLSDEARLVWLKDNLGEVAGDVEIDDVERANFPNAVHKILISAFRHAFSPRREGSFIPLLQVEYADSKPMVTVGGAFLANGTAVSYRSKIKSALPFLNTQEWALYEIKSLHLTERERSLFDRAVTSSNKRCLERNLLKKLGFTDSELNAYRDMVRYLPRYVETIV